MTTENLGGTATNRVLGNDKNPIVFRANMGTTHMAALSDQLEGIDPAKDSKKLVAQLENEFELVREGLDAKRKETEAGTFSSPHSPRQAGSDSHGLDL